MPDLHTPLPSLVEALEPVPPERIHALTAQPPPKGCLAVTLQPGKLFAAVRVRPRRISRRVALTLPPAHVDKCSAQWRRQPRKRAPARTVPRPRLCAPAASFPAAQAALKRGVLDGSIPSAAWDTACTSNAGRSCDPFIHTGQPSAKVFALADGRPAPATTVAKLAHNVREPARSVDIVPSLAGNSLLSGGKFAEAGYISICDGDEVNIYDGRTAKVVVSEEAVLKGWFCPRQRLWRIPLQQHVTNLNTQTLLLNGPTGTESLHSLYEVPSSPALRTHIKSLSGNLKEAINNVYELPSVEQSIRYLHGAAGFPTKATWLKSIRNGNYLSWPLANVKNVSKYFPESEETQKGHMRNQRQGVRSTKRAAKPNRFSPATAATGATEAIEKKGDIFVAVYEPRATFYTDQTGRFPQQSSRGNNYMMVLFDVDSSSTWVEPMKNRTEGELILARQRGLARMRLQGIIPTHQILDNEISAAYRSEIAATGMTHQLVPPDDHRRNIAEKALQTWKDHFIGILSGTADTFPLHLWCQIIPQAERQLLLLQQSNAHPTISAYAYVYGPHNYDAHPFVPIGMETLVHEKPRRRKTFAEHCKKGFVLGTSCEHYRAWTIWMNETRATRVSGTVFHKHKYISAPAVTPGDAVIAAAGCLAAAIKNNCSGHLAKEPLAELTRLSEIFAQASAPPALPPPATDMPRPVRRSPQLTTTVTAAGRIVATPAPRPAPPTNPPIPPPGRAMRLPRLTTVVSRDGRIAAVPRPVAPSATAPSVVQAARHPRVGRTACPPRVLPPRRSARLATRAQPPWPVPPPIEVPRPRVAELRRSARLAARTQFERPFAPPSSTTAPRAPEPDPATGPAHNTRARARAFRSVTQEAMLACVDIAQLRLSPAALSGRRFPIEMLNAVLDEDTGELMEYRALMKHPRYRTLYAQSYAKELGRLAQGIPGVVKGTNTIFFVDKSDVPADRWRDITYGRVVVNYRPEKDDPYRTRLTVGGDKVHYPGDCGTPTVDLLTVKLLLNSVVSTPGARFMTIDIKDFYLNTPMPRYEYMRLKLSDLPADFVEQNGLAAKVHANGYVYVEIRRGMYGLPQAGLLAQRLLEKRLNAEGYHQSPLTPGLWTHAWRPITFTLCVDDFGVKYVGQEHVDHLMAVLRKDYTISCDPDGKRYLGLDLDWDYETRIVYLSMLDYVKAAIARFQHKPPRKPQDQPHLHVKPKYGATKQYAPDDDDSPLLDQAGQKFVQEVIGTFLYYARAVDLTMLPALGSIATQQAQPTHRTLAKVKLFLDYAATHPDAIITYRASDMVLVGHSDASYLSESKARSRAGGHFFMSSDNADPPNNGAVLTIAQIIKNVMSSAAEAELGALFINCREAIPARHALLEMGHPQPPTPMQTDNTTALGVVNNNIASKRLKSMDMKLHWLRCRAAQEQFRHFWRPGPHNNADYVTKHHAAVHHRAVRPTYLTPKAHLDRLRQRATALAAPAA